MSVSDNERTFVPAELDVLEDALELPADAAPRLPVDLDDDARARIHGALIRYRAIERHAQALLREHEPPASVLAAVLAEARAAAASPVAPAPAARRAGSWWRALWIVPSVAALAGAAAVAVMITRSDSSSEAASPSATQAVARAESPSTAAPTSAAAPTSPPLADASTLQRGDDGTPRGAGARAEGALAEAAAEERDAAPEPEPELRRARSDAPGDSDVAGNSDDARDDLHARREKKSSGTSAPPAIAPGAAAPKSPAKPSTKNVDAPPKPAPTPAEDEAEVGAVDRLARADAARRRGDCDAARPDYQRVVAIGTTKQRARARAGLALCLERAGEREAARELYDQARADDAAIDAWISTER